MADEPIDLQQIAEDLNRSGAFDRAAAEQGARLLADPEWTTPGWIHVHEIVTAFAVGVLSADPWHRPYAVPPNLEAVLNTVARRVQDRWADEVVEVSLAELEDFYRAAIDAEPLALAWNDYDGPDVVAVTRFDATPSARDFIDLDALVRNAANYVRDDRRRERAFELKCEGESGQ